jgi:hypothetical protein
MDFLEFVSVLFGQLCEKLNKIIGHDLWYETFKIRNTKWLWLADNIVTAVNKNNILCGAFGLCPSFVAGILNSAKEIHFYVLCEKKS